MKVFKLKNNDILYTIINDLNKNIPFIKTA